MIRRLFPLLALALFVGCKSAPDLPAAQEITLYTSVDEPVARPIIDEFTKRTGIVVRLITDAEATKSAGLAARLMAEKANPQADVYWGNEVFHAINLSRNGCLQAYESPEAKTIPDRYKDPTGHFWAGTCLRARVIATAGGSASNDAVRIEDLVDPKFKGRVGLARPTAGTTGGHVSALYAIWGTEKADRFFSQLHDNGAKMLGGNSVVAEQVGQGQLLAGLTDNDDVAAAKKAGGQLRLHLPDQADGGLGTLTIPCTVGLVAGPRRGVANDPAKKLADYLLSDEVEKKLIAAEFGQYSVRASSATAVRTMNVSYEKIADQMSWAPGRAARILEGSPISE